MRRTIAGLVFATLLTTGAASASSFVTPAPMTAKLGPSMVMLGEPASAPVATRDQARPADTVARAIDEAPLDYPSPGGKGNASLTPADEAGFVRVSASIIAMAGPEEPAVSFEQVAAVNKDAGEEEADRRELFDPLPTVIRGGVVDNGGSAEVSVPVAPAQKPTVAKRPSSVAGTQASPGRGASSQAASSSQQPPREPDMPIPSPTPAPPPANIIPQTRIQ